ncbi:MAG: hypothetical protein OES13_08195, partial [Acidimicrobiia bacterium]|nr:hypothetical protein [Acidimicrobiia bacterium]
MRRIITGHDEAGRSVFRSAEPFLPTVTSPRADWFEAWATYADDTLPIDAAEHTDRDRYSERHPAFPRVGESPTLV